MVEVQNLVEVRKMLLPLTAYYFRILIFKTHAVPFFIVEFKPETWRPSEMYI